MMKEENGDTGSFDVTTVSKNGQWVNQVEGAPHLSQSYRDKEEALQAAREFALSHNSRHRVEASEPTGAISDPDPATQSE